MDGKMLFFLLLSTVIMTCDSVVASKQTKNRRRLLQVSEKANNSKDHHHGRINNDSEFSIRREQKKSVRNLVANGESLGNLFDSETRPTCKNSCENSIKNWKRKCKKKKCIGCEECKKCKRSCKKKKKNWEKKCKMKNCSGCKQCIPTLTPTANTSSPTYSPTVFLPLPEGPFIYANSSSEVVVIPNPPSPHSDDTASGLDRKNCPHLQPNLMDWHNSSTWAASQNPPTANSDVTLPPNSKVIIRKSVMGTLGLVTIPSSSELLFGEQTDGIQIDAAGFQVDGILRAGSEECRYETPLGVTLHGSRPSDITTKKMPEHYKGIAITGTIHIHGKRYYRTWTRLAKTAQQGDDFLLLQHPVNWEIGQTIILTTTALKDSRDWHQNEIYVVDSVRVPPEGVGALVYLKAPVQYTHIANSSYQAEVGLLSRMIKISGADDDSEPTDPDPGTCIGSKSFYGNHGIPCSNSELTGYGGHIIVYSGGFGYVEGVELYRMGQTNVIGRYPMHFHILGDGCTGCYFRDSSVHHSFYRCISVHGTDNILVSENVGFDVIGYCYYLEDGVEEDNTISYNLAAFIHFLGDPVTGNGQTTPIFKQSPTLTLPADVTAAGFYITNVHNNIIGNAASGGWAGFAFPVLHSPIGPHKTVNTRPSSKTSLIIDGNTAHSSGWWWYHAGAFYFGGTLYYDSDGETLLYNAGRDHSRSRSPCLVDHCVESNNCNEYCQVYDQAWNQITNTKAFLVPSVGLNSWSGRMEVIGYEASDMGLSLEALQPGFWIDKMLAVCRTGESFIMPPNTQANWIKGNGFFWYDTGQEHIITNSVFRNCGYRGEYDEYDTSPTRGCDSSQYNGCNSGSIVFGFLTHSDQFTPEIMQATRNITFQDCGRRFKLDDFNGNNEPSTVSGRGQNWIDVDGSVSGLGEPTIIGSGLEDAGLWWKVDHDVVFDPHGPLQFIKQNAGPSRGLAHMTIIFDSNVHSSVGSSTCGNGGNQDCPSLGTVRHFGPMFALPEVGLPITARADIVGPVGGYGWLLNIDKGAPHTLKITQIEVLSGTPLLLGIVYPIGTSFIITAHAAWCGNSQWYSCEEIFTEVSSVAEVRASLGNTYHIDDSNNGILLTVRVIQTPKSFVGNPDWILPDFETIGKWNNGYAIERFSRENITLPIGSTGPYLEILADCVKDTGMNSAYCVETLPTITNTVCSSGFEQIAYDRCCKIGDPSICEFA